MSYFERATELDSFEWHERGSSTSLASTNNVSSLTVPKAPDTEKTGLGGKVCSRLVIWLELVA